jgi:hypothetical protein
MALIERHLAGGFFFHPFFIFPALPDKFTGLGSSFTEGAFQKFPAQLAVHCYISIGNEMPKSGRAG